MTTRRTPVSRASPSPRRRLSAAGVFWRTWCVASVVWVVFAFFTFPQRWQDQTFWSALLAEDERVLTIEDCGHVLDTDVARGCQRTVSMARERVQNQRLRELTSAFSSIGTLFGPPVMALLGAVLFTALFGDRFNRHPPEPRPAGHGAHASDIRLPPTTYVPPHRRRNSDDA